jgi:hypothetical protein
MMPILRNIPANKLLNILFAGIFYMSGYAQVAEEKKCQFDILIDFQMKYMERNDTIHCQIRQKYNSAPHCSNYMYSENNLKDSSIKLIDTLLNRYSIFRNQPDAAYHRKVYDINESRIFSPLTYGFDSIMNRKCDSIKHFPFKNIYYLSNDSLEISSAYIVEYNKKHEPISMIFNGRMGEEVQYESFRLLKKFKTDENICIDFPPELKKNLKVIDCSEGRVKKYDAYENLKSFNLGELLISNIRNENQEILYDKLDSINLVFIFTQSCLPCHWFIGDIDSISPILNQTHTKLISVLPYKPSSKDIEYLKLKKTKDLEIYSDYNSILENKYLINQFPFFLVLNKKGDVLDYRIGYGKKGFADIEELIQKHIN